MSANIKHISSLASEAEFAQPISGASTNVSKIPDSGTVPPHRTNHTDNLNRLARFRHHHADWGLRRAVYWELMNFLGRRGFRIHLVGVGATRFDLFNPVPPEVPPGYDTRQLLKADLEPFVDKLTTDLTQDFLDQAFENEDVCVGTFYGDELVAFSFDSRTRTTVNDQLDVLIPEGFKYGYKAWTHEDHRRKNLSKMIGNFKWKELKRDYGERGIWYIETHNYPSRLHGYLHPRQWSVRVGYVGWFTLFGRQIPFNTRWAKKIGFEFVRKDDSRRRYYGG
jgi:hypothetical protein